MSLETKDPPARARNLLSPLIPVSSSLPSSLSALLLSSPHSGTGGVQYPWVFSLGWQITRVPPYVRRPFPFKENRQISERDDLGPPVLPGGQEIGLGSRNLRPRAEARPTGRAVSRSAERLGDWDGQMEV
jgi:hypothetical protein